MKTYPLVRSEEETLRRVLAGASLARYGDGEFKHCADQRNVSQEHDQRLSQRLREILIDSGTCMVGIPNLRAVARMTPDKAAFWGKYTFAAKWLTERPYCSSFITRPDSAPWVNTPEYFRMLETLWMCDDVTLVRGSHKGLTVDDLEGAGHVTEVLCDRQHSFAKYDEILARVGTPKRALICLGPTATVLAVDLAARGVHAIDLGHAALFLRKFRRGEPLTLTREDKSHDKVPA